MWITHAGAPQLSTLDVTRCAAPMGIPAGSIDQNLGLHNHEVGAGLSASMPNPDLPPAGRREAMGGWISPCPTPFFRVLRPASPADFDLETPPKPGACAPPDPQARSEPPPPPRAAGYPSPSRPANSPYECHHRAQQNINIGSSITRSSTSSASNCSSRRGDIAQQLVLGTGSDSRRCRSLRLQAAKHTPDAESR